MKSKRRPFTVNRIALLALLIALTYVGRIALQFIPNVQPVTAVLIIITLTMGAADGLIVAIATIFLSNLLLGMGPWTFIQILAYTIIILFTAYIMTYIYHSKYNGSRLIMACYAFLTGIIYGLIMSIVTVKMMGITSFWGYYLAGIPFDIMHGLGNFIFYIILEPILKPLIQRQRR